MTSNEYDAVDVIFDGIEEMQRRAREETDTEKKKLLRTMASNLTDEIEEKCLDRGNTSD